MPNVFMITTRKQRYKIMSTFSNDAAYQEILWGTYKNSVKNDICNVCSMCTFMLFMIFIYLQLLRGVHLISVNTVFFIATGTMLLLMILCIILYGIVKAGVKLSTGNSDFTINSNILNYLNDIAQKNFKIIENDNVHVLQDDDDTLRIIVNTTILKQKYLLQVDIDNYKVHKKQYFKIDENGHVQSHNDYVLMYDGQIVSSCVDEIRSAHPVYSVR